MSDKCLRRAARFSRLAAVFALFAALTANGQVATTQRSTQSSRDALLAIIDRPRVALLAQETAQGNDGDFLKFRFVFSSEAAQRVPGILLALPQVLHDGKRHAVVIVLHGTSQNKEAELPVLRLMAAKGFIAVAIDGRYHGERGNQADYNAAIARAFTDGKSHPLYFDTVWDVMRLIDYLQSRSDVDPDRIGLIGFSKGGIETWLTAAIDPRVAVAVPCISAQSFAWGLQNDAWHHRAGTFQKGFDAAAKSVGIDKPDAAFTQRFYDRVIPGIYTTFDCPQLLPLIAPRPLLLINGEKDPINPIQGVRLCEQSTRAAYTNAGVPDRFQLIIEPNAAHVVTAEAKSTAADWFAKWLGSQPVKR